MKKFRFLGMLFLALTLGFTSCNNKPEEPDFPDLPGDGTESLPYSVLDAINNQGNKDDNDYKWVKGYIVGLWEGKNEAGEDIYPNNFAKFAAPFYTDVNILLADSPDETTQTRLLCVQLTSGAIRDKLNLVGNSDILKKEVLLCGALKSYNKFAGMKSTQYFELKDGTTGGTKPGTIIGEGNGTKEEPYNIEAARGKQNNQKAWAKGYIVGSVKSGDKGTIESNDDVVFGIEGIRPSTVLLADSKDVTDYNSCIIVNLPVGEIRRAINLVDNPENIHKEVMIYGVFRTYFGVSGIKDLEGYLLDGQGIDPGDNPDPEPTDPEPVTTLTENFELFTAGNGYAYFNTQPNNKGWNGYVATGTLEPDVREYNNNTYVQFSAHRSSISTNTDQEFWLVSPRLDITNASIKTLSFETAGGYFNDNTVFKVYIIDGDDPTTADKTELTGWTLAAKENLSGSYTPFIPSGSIDLSNHSGTKRIAFYYKGQSGSGNSTTYQLDNFNFGN